MKCWGGRPQAGIKISGGNINNLRYADDTTIMAESEEGQLDEDERKNEKVGLKFNIQKMKIMAFSPITSWQTEGEKVFSIFSDRFYFLGFQNHCRW